MNTTDQLVVLTKKGIAKLAMPYLWYLRINLFSPMY